MCGRGGQDQAVGELGVTLSGAVGVSGNGEPQQPSEPRNDGTVSPATPPGKSSNCPKLWDR